MDDEGLLRQAEEALTEIKVSQGLSEEHAAVLAALRIRLTGTADKTLEEMLAASEDRPEDVSAKIAEAERASASPHETPENTARPYHGVVHPTKRVRQGGPGHASTRGADGSPGLFLATGICS